MKIKLIAAVLLAAAFHALAADSAAPPEPVKSIFIHYMKIQAALAGDSMKGVPGDAAFIAKAAQADDSKSLPPTVAKYAGSLAQAKDLAGAREAFKSLSNSLIKYLVDHPAPKGAYYEVYCPMAQASWLQTNKTIANPYMGKDMATCGEIKE
jgi:hypothetical protein